MHALKRKRALILLGDIISFYAALVAVLALRTGLSRETFASHFAPFSGLFVLWLLVFFLFNLYEPDAVNPTPRTVGKLLLAYAVSFFLGVLFFYVTPGIGIAPKSNLALIAIVSCALVVLLRRLAYQYFERGLRQTVAFYGESATNQFRADIERSEHFKIDPTVITDMKMFSSLATPPDLLIIPEHLSKDELVSLAAYGGEIARIESTYEMLFAKVPLALMTPEKALACMERRYSPWSVFTRTAEIFLAALVLILTLPFTVLVTLAILIESGRPIFFVHDRVGKNERIFRFYKFRSMRKDAESNGVQWAAENDSRVTFVGKILRKSHIDEIPQFWNIIKGDLALVGPRAERPEFVEKLKAEIPYYFLRHIVRPGFTGWAQIKYRYARTVDDSREKFEYDLFYIKNQSLLLDLGIVVKTVQIIFTH